MSDIDRLAEAIRCVGGYMTDDESQAAFGIICDVLEERSGAIRRLKAQVDELQKHDDPIEQMNRKLDVLVDALNHEPNLHIDYERAMGDE